MRVPPRLRTILVCAMLEFAALVGSPMRPEEIEELMRTMNQPKLAHVLRDERRHGDGDPEPAPDHSTTYVECRMPKLTVEVMERSTSPTTSASSWRSSRTRRSTFCTRAAATPAARHAESNSSMESRRR